MDIYIIKVREEWEDLIKKQIFPENKKIIKYNSNKGFVVRASCEGEARGLAVKCSEEYGEEDAKGWFIGKYSSCVKLGEIAGREKPAILEIF